MRRDNDFDVFSLPLVIVHVAAQYQYVLVYESR